MKGRTDLAYDVLCGSPIVNPPSTTNSPPVEYEDSSEAR
jgi:hypothetical protein